MSGSIERQRGVFGILAALCALGGAARAQDEPRPTPAEAPAREGPSRADAIAPLAPRYHAQEEAGQLIAAWLATGLAERVELGTTEGGRPIVGVQFGGRGAAPLAERTTIFLLGGMDGTSFSGAEAVIAVADALLAAPELLTPDVTFIAVPWANPDGLARSRASGCADGSNDRPTDDDFDGTLDEDGPDDLDGDGQILEMLIEDPAGEWVRGPDGRFLARARAGQAPRYRRVREGRDDDGDGLFNEDASGGVCVDQNFPIAWQSWGGVHAGPWPLSEPAARALAELALARRTALVVAFQGNHGALATPGGVPENGLELPFPEDVSAFGVLTDLFQRTTGRAQPKALSLAAARGAPRPGAAIDWFYAALGALSVEVAPWGPAVEAAPGDTLPGRFAREGRFVVGAPGDAAEPASGDEAWALWLDNTRGGIGFVDWQPVDLGAGLRGLVGGWEPTTCFNPPPDALGRALQGLDAFTLRLARALPRLEIDVRDPVRDGRICRLTAVVRNVGELPTGAGRFVGRTGTVLSLELPEGVTLLAGERRVDLGHLPGGSSSQPREWLLAAPEGSVFRLRVEGRFNQPVVREVRL